MFESGRVGGEGGFCLEIAFITKLLHEKFVVTAELRKWVYGKGSFTKIALLCYVS